MNDGQVADVWRVKRNTNAKQFKREHPRYRGVPDDKFSFYDRGDGINMVVISRESLTVEEVRKVKPGPHVLREVDVR